jgi:site-specific DNA-methyltransferase (adenine-specific)
VNVVHKADVLDALRAMPDNSFHGCLTDPPYGLSFMGHQWDHGVPSVEVWREVLRVLRPGAHLLAFGGTRTFHRLTCAIEDAGFEIRDCMSWLYGSGFPKSLDVGKVAPAFAGHGTALKPAWEPIIVARKPLEGTVAANVQRWGCGALAIDASRVPGLADKPGGKIRSVRHFDGHETGRADKDAPEPNPLGRWPANVIFDRAAAAILDAQSGTLQARGNKAPSTSKKAIGAAYGKYGPASSGPEYNQNDSGGASRFFYCAKASRAERDAGLEDFAVVTRAEQTRRKEGSAGSKNPAAGSGSTEGGRNVHPTVKPLALTAYLARLILPPVEGTRLLVPFCGSGSEMIGGLRAGWSHVEGIDSWDVAVRIARARLAHAAAGVP